MPALTVAAVLGAGATIPASASAGSAGTVTREGVPAFGHVFLVIGENTTYSHLTTVNAPYLLGTLRPRQPG